MRDRNISREYTLGKISNKSLLKMNELNNAFSNNLKTLVPWVFPHFTYGIEDWGCAKTLIDKIEIIQRESNWSCSLLRAYPTNSHKIHILSHRVLLDLYI